MIKQLALAVAVQSFASAAPQEQSREMAQKQKLLQPGVHHAELDRLAGSWTVAVTFKLGPGAEYQSTATSEAKWILGGRFLQQQYKNESGLEVLQFLGYDNQKERFFEIKMDNMETGLLRTEGAISPDGNVITNYGDRIDPLSGMAGKLRTVTTIVDHDHYTVEWYLTGPGGPEEKIVTMKHTRK